MSVECSFSTTLLREGDHGECLWYAPGGLIEAAFYLQCFNAFLPDLIAFTDLAGHSP